MLRSLVEFIPAGLFLIAAIVLVVILRRSKSEAPIRTDEKSTLQQVTGIEEDQ